MQNSENKVCQNCKQNFVIESEDFDFYKKIDVPPPTWCPECRMIRRFVRRDNHILYKRKSDFTGDEILTVFGNSSLRKKIYERDVWWSDKWDPMSYGKEYNFSKPFFQQFAEMLLEVPVPAHTVYNVINSDYSAGSNDLKNCYLLFISTNCEDSAYGSELNKTKNSFDVTKTESSEFCYESFGLTKCYKTFFSSHCEDCIDVWFSKNLTGCSDCFGCINLRNKKYYIFNQPFSKEEYHKKLGEMGLGSYEKINEIKEESKNVFLKNIEKFYHGRYNTNASGEYINNSKNVSSAYNVNQVENSKYVQMLFTPTAKDSYDHTLWGENSELIYECSNVGDQISNLKFCDRCYINCNNLEYSNHCNSSSYLFGCVGLRNKQYCVLNKQYTKEEYGELMPQIIEHMNSMPYVDKKGRVYKYGEFFPMELSPFLYNETIAQEYFPLTKEQAIEKGYSWKDPETRNYKIEIMSDKLPDNIKDVQDDIVSQAIECRHQGKCNEQCTEAFRIISQELQFYKQINLPLPRLCPNCRHHQRIKQRNPIKLQRRKCQCSGLQSENGVYKNTTQHFHQNNRCPNEFETSYAPERQEIIYCEQCYNSEVS